jgi:hypothetical protein
VTRAGRITGQLQPQPRMPRPRLQRPAPHRFLKYALTVQIVRNLQERLTTLARWCANKHVFTVSHYQCVRILHGFGGCALHNLPPVLGAECALYFSVRGGPRRKRELSHEDYQYLNSTNCRCRSRGESGIRSLGCASGHGGMPGCDGATVKPFPLLRRSLPLPRVRLPRLPPRSRAVPAEQPIGLSRSSQDKVGCNLSIFYAGRQRPGCTGPVARLCRATPSNPRRAAHLPAMLT